MVMMKMRMFPREPRENGLLEALPNQRPTTPFGIHR